MCDVLFKDPNYTWFLFICYIYHVPVIKKYLTDINVPIKIKKKKKSLKMIRQRALWTLCSLAMLDLLTP